MIPEQKAMILKGRVQKRLSNLGGVRIRVPFDKHGAQSIRISTPLAIDWGLAAREEGGWYFEGIEQDVEIEVRRVDH